MTGAGPLPVERLFQEAIDLQRAGRQVESEARLRRVLEIVPNAADAHHLLGVCLRAQGRAGEADASFRRSLDLKAEFADEGRRLASQLLIDGDPSTALNVILQSLAVMETEGARRIFVDCARRVRFTQEDHEVRAMAIRALNEHWARPGELAETGINLVKLNPVVKGLLGRSPLGAEDLAALGADALLRVLLSSTPARDIELERLLLAARRAMLELAGGPAATDAGADAALDFCGALASQCFINEYVFACTQDDSRRAEELRVSLNAALGAGAKVAGLHVLAVAAFLPLSSLPLARRLLDAQWPSAVAAVLVQQIREPEEERRLRESISCLTGIDDKVSQLVREQYEENPYPRWAKAAPVGNATELVEYLRRKFPLVPLAREAATDGIDVLIAGCGTGQHAIETSRLFRGARVLAIDLSRNSLGYARRKTLELGIVGIEYAQADLLQVGSLGRKFDLIESVGVLHHLADPWAGWRALLAVLRPHGIMRLGFYSEAARRNIVKARAFIAQKGYGATPDDIRKCRQDFLDPGVSAELRSVAALPDFFSVSECRDLLFHVQEHRMTLDRIDAFLRENRLGFVGFEIGDDVRRAYRARFPGDHAEVDLAQWQRFENDNPDTFIDMYQFWVQKPG